jgi:hypothetical protein
VATLTAVDIFKLATSKISRRLSDGTIVEDAEKAGREQQTMVEASCAGRKLAGATIGGEPGPRPNKVSAALSVMTPPSLHNNSKPGRIKLSMLQIPGIHGIILPSFLAKSSP